MNVPYYVTAGSQLAGGVLGGFLLGVWLGKVFNQAWFPIAGFFLGLLIGGFSAFRLLLRGK